MTYKTKYEKADILFSNIRPYLKKIWFADKDGGCSNDAIVFRSSNPDKFLPKYIFYVLSMDMFFDFVMSGKQGLKMPRGNKDKIPQFQVPIPKKDVQERIIEECSAIDKEAEKAEKTITKFNDEAETLYQEASTKANIKYKLSASELFELSIGKRVLKNEINNEGKGIPVFSANVFEPFGHLKKELIKDFNTPSILWGIDGDWMVNVMPKDEPFYPADHSGVLRIKGDEIHPKYIAWALQKEGERVRFQELIVLQCTV